ncbi:unnamed protein product, partial [Darwinula stevensoni]
MSVSETILRRQWPIFLEYLDVDAISPILISKYVLPVDWMDNGEKPLRAREKREAILRIVRAKGRTGFQAFKKALAQVGQSHLVSSHALDALPNQKACLPFEDDDAGVAAFMKGARSRSGRVSLPNISFPIFQESRPHSLMPGEPSPEDRVDAAEAVAVMLDDAEESRDPARPRLSAAGLIGPTAPTREEDKAQCPIGRKEEREGGREKEREEGREEGREGKALPASFTGEKTSNRTLKESTLRADKEWRLDEFVKLLKEDVESSLISAARQCLQEEKAGRRIPCATKKVIEEAWGK